MKHLKRFLANIISIFVFDKQKKQRIIQSISEFSIKDLQQIKLFQSIACRDNSVLLIETNGCHGEVISAYWKYFQDTGYNVDILMHEFIYKEHHFSRQNIKKTNIFHCYTTCMHYILQSQKIKQYKHIIIMTPMNYTFETQPVLQIFPELKPLKNLYIIAHNIPDIEKHYKKFNQQHIIGLGRRLNSYPCVNPHLFGKTIKKTHRHTPVTFITVGGINPRRKNHNQLIEAIEKLVQKRLNFKVIIVGDGGKIKNISPTISKHIEMPGRQIAEKMFQYMEQADFFLPLWDPTCLDHIKYRTNQVSGSPQLIYGFNKIPIVQSEFANFYDFNDTNAILYTTDLSKAMEQAINMSNKEFLNKHVALSFTQQEIYKESLNNLKNILKK